MSTEHSQVKPGSAAKAHIDELLKRVEQGVEELRSSEGFKRYLKAQSKFHQYSFNNCILIALQCPEASYVAGYRTWSSFGNVDEPVYVRKGEKGIQILAPAPYKKIVEEKDADGNSIVNEYGEPVKKEIIVSAFKPVYVYDISQVEGIEESALNPCKTLDGVISDFKELKEALICVAGVPVTFKECSVNGYYAISTDEIVIKDGMSHVQTIKTLAHEIAHSRLHAKVTPEQEELFERIGTEDFEQIACIAGYESYRAMYEDGNRIEGYEDITPEVWEQYETYGITRAMKETQAEAIAFIVCEHYGIDSSTYSFPYITTWGNADAKELKESLRVIQRTAMELIGKIDKQLEMKRFESAEECAYKINGYGYLHMQCSIEGGYEYSLYNNKLQLVDGGYIDDNSVSIDVAAKNIMVQDNGFEVYRIREIDVNKLMSQLESRSEQIQSLARNIAVELGMMTEDMEESERNSIVTRVTCDLDTANPKCIEQLKLMADTSKQSTELIKEVSKLIEIKSVQGKVALQNAQ